MLVSCRPCSCLLFLDTLMSLLSNIKHCDCFAGAGESVAIDLRRSVLNIKIQLDFSGYSK